MAKQSATRLQFQGADQAQDLIEDRMMHSSRWLSNFCSLTLPLCLRNGSPNLKPLIFALLLLLSFGGLLAAAEPMVLHAGTVSLVFEPDYGMIRYIRVGEQTILQGINAPVRDQFWGTVAPVVDNVVLDDRGDSFELSFDVSCRRAEIDFFWKGSVSGESDGTLVFKFDGEARSTFLRNRIGFCVLHGPEAAGKPCVIETVAGQKRDGHFPAFISPHQPFKNIRAIKHEVSNGVWARVQMEGDTFEMEDQRNWTDASFKTYCTPLELPYPVQVEKGTRIANRVELSIEGAGLLQREGKDAPTQVSLHVTASNGLTKKLPAIGLQVSSQARQLSAAEVDQLRALNLDHLRVDIPSPGEEPAATLRRAASDAEQLEVSLHVGLSLAEDASTLFDAMEPALKEIQQPSHWLLSAGNGEQERAVREFLVRTGQTGKLGRAEDTNFTELNRNRPDPSTIDFGAYGLNPQMHAFDNTSLIETLAIQGDTVRTARQFLGDLPLFISPITLRKQQVDEEPRPGELPAKVDPRQPSLFTAGWTLGSIKYLAEAGVDSITYFETLGWLGIMEAAGGSPNPSKFPSRPGELFPTLHALRALAEYKNGLILKTKSSDPMAVVGLTVADGDRHRLFIVNLTPSSQTAIVHGFGQAVDLRRLDNRALVEDILDPLRKTKFVTGRGRAGLEVELPPNGIAILDRR